MGKQRLRGVSINIILLGIVSFLTDTSSEMMMPILPMFIVALGGSALAVGLIGGLGDSVTSILQVFSGYWSDRSGKRKPFVSSGYAFSAISKMFLPLSLAWQHVLILRPLERAGKGLRTAPRDAIIADSALQTVRGKAFGIHRTMDTGGAVLGSVLAFVLFWFLGLEFRTILLVSAIVGFLALVPLYPVKEREIKPKKAIVKLSLKELPKDLRLFIVASTIFAMGNFSYMFFILRAQEFFTPVLTERMATALPILLYVLFNVVYTSFATPSGVLSDRIGRRNVLLTGYSLFGLTCMGFAFLPSLTSFMILFCVYGLVYALVDGTQRAFVSDLAPEDRRGTALGTFHTSVGFASLPASLIAGYLWQYVSPATTFVYGLILGFVASTLLAISTKYRGSPKPKKPMNS